MSRHTRPQSYACDVCDKPTSRLYGFLAVVRIAGADGATLTRFRTSIRGFCAAHRDEIPARFARDVAAEGEVDMIAEPPALLRPNAVDGFLQSVDEMTHQAGVGMVGESAYIELADGRAPAACPHCGGRLSVGTGPHVADAAQRPGATAWECLDCHAAGLITGRPPTPAPS